MSKFTNSLRVTNLINPSLRKDFNNLVNNLSAEDLKALEEEARRKGYAGAWEAFRHGEFKEKIHDNLSKTENDEHKASLNSSYR